MIVADLKTDRGSYDVFIDGVRYGLLGPTELSLRDHIRISEANSRVMFLKKEIAAPVPDNPSKKEMDSFLKRAEEIATEMNEQLETILTAVMRKIPKRVRDKLTPVQRVGLVEAYGRAMMQEQMIRSAKSGAETAADADLPFSGGDRQLPG